jgi:hypothetical protein
MPDRAQSELVGAILVLGLVVVSVGVAGAYAMGTVTQSTDTPDTVITGQIGTDGITLSHQGGDSLPSDELRLVVRVNGSETGLAWSDGTLSGGDDVFDPGEGWTASESYDPGSLVTVRLVDEPTNTVLFRTETTVTAQEPVESDMGGQIDAIDSEGEIEQGDISTPTTPTDPDLGQLIRARDPTAGEETVHIVNYTIAEDSNTAGNSLNTVVIEYPADSVDLSDVDERDDVLSVGIDRDRDGTIDVDATDDVECCPPGDGVITPNSNTLRIEFSGNYNLEGGDALVIEYEEVENPAAGNYPVTVTVNGEVSDSGTLEIDPSDDDDDDDDDENGPPWGGGDDDDDDDDDDDEDDDDDDDDNEGKGKAKGKDKDRDD